MQTKFLLHLKSYLLIILSILTFATLSEASTFNKLQKPPLDEHWFGIYVDNTRVGFYNQKFTETSDGYRIDTSGSVKIKVMGFSKEATTRETFFVSKSLSLRSFDVTHNLNGILSRVSGKKYDTSMRIKIEAPGKTTNNQIKFQGDLYPGPALNIYPLTRDRFIGKTFKIFTFDPEELKVKEVKISVFKEETAPNGQAGLKMRNSLYFMVNNDIWVDPNGNTLWESVRDGLVITRQEDPAKLGYYVGNLAVARKDLIQDFSLVKTEPAIKDQLKIKGLAVEISGWNDAIPLLQSSGQSSEKSGSNRIIIKTGTAAAAQPATVADKMYLAPQEQIESDAPAVIEKAREISKGKTSREETAKALSSWTTDWLKETVDDGGSALSGLNSRSGNCITRARLYTALARAAGIPSRFVTGLISIEGKGFQYHSWAESWIDGKWIAVDPAYSQFPADPTHLKLFEGPQQADLSSIITIIGKIQVKVLESRFQ